VNSKNQGAEKWARQEKEGGRYEMIHFFALLNRIKILPGTRMERFKG
jgi:hypothetical protein